MKLYSPTEQVNFTWWRLIREFGWKGSGNFGQKLMKGQIWITANANFRYSTLGNLSGILEIPEINNVGFVQKIITIFT